VAREEAAVALVEETKAVQVVAIAKEDQAEAAEIWVAWAVAAQAAECKIGTQLRLGFLFSGGTAAACRL